MRARGISPFKAGALTLVVVAVVCWAGFTKLTLPFGSHYEVKAIFRTAATEVKKGTPVRIAGVDVGKVQAVEPGPGGTAEVTLRMQDEGRPLHRDATMKIRPRLFLEGNFFVDVRPGSPGQPELADGATVPLTQTAIPVQLDEVLSTLQRDSRQDLKATVEGLTKALDEGGADAVRAGVRDWTGAFQGTALTAEAMRGARPGDLGRFVERQAQVSRALAVRDRELADLVTGFARTVTALGSSRQDLGASLRALDRTVSTATPALREVRATLPALRTFADTLRPALRAAPSTIDEARPFVRAGSGLLGDAELPALTRRLRPALASLETVTPQLDELLGRVTPISTCVSRSVVPVLNAQVDDGKLSTGLPIWRELTSMGAGLASSGGNFDGNGGQIRYLAGGAENLVTTALPGIGDLYALTSEPLLGARPRWTPNTEPPFAPEAKCEEQALPDLRADSAPAPAQKRLGLSRKERSSAVSGAIKRLRKLDTRKELRSALAKARQADRRAAK
ncbi:MlaD family protein [Conexibacter sp. SYSU D00693]|uniref:MlaD family protein n=1 Tax=Conexibacter sp. SYSU D00693 TaxID=2812560 RepID=UPI00196ADE79|nr:MlaD family protein [Conexibacter sp. SYSU D00693]